MPDFDPYHKWLGISPENQPADHYRLLGVERFESDPDVIATAADQRMAHLRTFQAGARAELSQRLLNELASARVVLLNAQKKAAYDQELRRVLSAVAPASRPTAQPLAAEPPSLPNQVEWTPATEPVAASSRIKAKQGRPPWVMASVAAASLLLMGILVWGVLGGGEPSKVAGPEGARRSANRLAKKPSGLPPSRSSSNAAAKSRPHPPSDNSAGHDHPAVESGPAESASSAGEASEPNAEPPPVDDPAGPSAATPPPSAEPPSAPEPEPPLRDAALPEAEPDETQSMQTPATPAESAEPSQAAVPAADAIEKGEEDFRSVFGEQLDAAEEPDDQAALAERLIQLGRQPQTPPPERYVVLRRAIALAAEAGRTELMLQAIDAKTEHFTIDPWAAKVGAFALAFEPARPAEHRVAIAEKCLAVADQAIAAEALEAAEALLEMALTNARRSRSTDLLKSIIARRDDVEALNKVHRAAQEAATTLAEEPNNPVAATVRGKYLAVYRHDWEAGLPLLAKGDDSVLAELAKTDMAKPAEAAEQLDLADGWFRLSENSSAEESQAYSARAAWWYHKAIPALDGLDATRARKRLVAMEIERAHRIPPDIGLEHADSIPVGQVKQYGFPGGLIDIAATPNGRSFLAVGWGGSVVWYDLAAGKEILRYKPGSGVNYGIAVSPDGHRAVCGGRGSMRMLDLKTQQWDVLETKLWFFEPVFFKDSCHVVWGTSGGARIFDLDAKKEVRKLGGTPGWVQGTDMSRDERIILTGGTDNTARVLDVATSKEIHRMKGQGYLRTATISPNGQIGITGGDEGVVQLWDLRQGKELHRLEGGGGIFIADGRWILTTGKNVRLWNPADGKRVASVDASAACAVTLPDHRFVLLGSGGTIRLWRLPLNRSGELFDGQYERSPGPEASR